MSKKHKGGHDEHVNHERWLVSYADFITLLFAFFVVLFSSSQVDSSKTNKMSLAVSAAFSSFSIFKEKAGKLSIFDAEESEQGAGGAKRSVILSKVKVEQNEMMDILLLPHQFEYLEEGFVVKPSGDPDLASNVGVLSNEEEALARAQRDIMAILDKKKMNNLMTVNMTDQGVTISLNDLILFEPGSAELDQVSKEKLYGIAYIISLLPNHIRIEGHSSEQLDENSPYQSNWKLSADRAISVLDWFEQKFKMDPKRLSITAYGSHRPIVDTKSDLGILKNSRVDIILLSKEAAIKQGLDVSRYERAPLPILLPKAPQEEKLLSLDKTESQSSDLVLDHLENESLPSPETNLSKDEEGPLLPNVPEEE